MKNKRAVTLFASLFAVGLLAIGLYPNVSQQGLTLSFVSDVPPDQQSLIHQFTFYPSMPEAQVELKLAYMGKETVNGYAGVHTGWAILEVLPQDNPTQPGTRQAFLFVDIWQTGKGAYTVEIAKVEKLAASFQLYGHYYTIPAVGLQGEAGGYWLAQIQPLTQEIILWKGP